MAYSSLYDPLDTLFKPQRTGVKISAGDTILAILLGLLGFKFICQLMSKTFILASASEGLFSTCMCFLAPASPSAQIHPSRGSARQNLPYQKGKLSVLLLRGIESEWTGFYLVFCEKGRTPN